MPRYAVDVKAFINVEVEAPDASTARRYANDFVETLSPDPNYVAGYNQEQDLQQLPVKVVEASGFDIDGVSVVDELSTLETEHG